MKSFLYIIIVAFILVSCGTHVNTYQNKSTSSYTIKTRYYNKDGHYTGYSIQTESGKIRYYDKSGKYKGYSNNNK